MTETVGFAIPSIPLPTRQQMLLRCIESIQKQTYPVSQISVAFDHDRQSAGPTRNKAMMNLTTDWVGFVDDDDWLYDFHVELLLNHAHETDADLVFGHYDVIGGQDPFPQFQGLPWDDAVCRVFPITYLVKRELIQQCEFPANPTGNWVTDDYPVVQKIIELGGKITNTPQRTWAWAHHGANSSGCASNW